MFAEAVLNWTDKEVLTGIGTAVVATVSAISALAWIVVKHLIEKTRIENEHLKRELERSKKAGDAVRLREDLEATRTSYAEAMEKLGKLRAECEAHAQQSASGAAALQAVVGERAAAAAAAEEVGKSLYDAQRKIKNAVGRDGLTWNDNVLQSQLVKFKPLDPAGRRTPIISVLNLKGGVGKTTTTAHLGAMLSTMGYRVMLVDLDLQGSLTEHYTRTDELDALYNDRKLVADFLERSFDAEYPDINDYAHPILADTNSVLVPTTDVMAYAELNLTVRWFLRDSSRDPRFLLRRELQLCRITDKFDIILLDCPPLLNMSCVNALAASDFVLTPVMPSKQVTDRVNILADRVKEFQKHLNPDLRFMGFFANRTHGAALTADELTRLAHLRKVCRDVLDKDNAQFAAFIPQSKEIRMAEDDERTLDPSHPSYAAFRTLAREVESRLPAYCRKRGAAVAAGGAA